jgi:hypothetical protein
MANNTPKKPYANDKTCTLIEGKALFDHSISQIVFMYKMTFASDIDVLFEKLIETPLSLPKRQ